MQGVYIYIVLGLDSLIRSLVLSVMLLLRMSILKIVIFN